jgi:hypothetical protein
MAERFLTDADVDAIATRLADLLAERSGTDRRLVSAATLARQLELDARWVREHARELGGVQLGDGPKARWRFDPVEARNRLAARRQEPSAQRASRNVEQFPTVRPRRRRRSEAA